MDYTALDGCDWEEALLPHLRWAYAERASVGVVRVGSSRAADPLRADRVVARGVLASTIEAALQPQRGAATPLAHGLELAAQTLQAEIQRGRGGARRARLVVLTDGRGNVPLAASRAGAVDGPVYHRGIDDALQAARALGAMTHVDAFFLDPRPSLYPDVPLALAQALRATVEVVAPADVVESEGG
jgi:magnesium chelatase subunit D